jgi:hypothetical protein
VHLATQLSCANRPKLPLCCAVTELDWALVVEVAGVYSNSRGQETQQPDDRCTAELRFFYLVSPCLLAGAAVEGSGPWFGAAQARLQFILGVCFPKLLLQQTALPHGAAPHRFPAGHGGLLCPPALPSRLHHRERGQPVQLGALALAAPGQVRAAASLRVQLARVCAGSWRGACLGAPMGPS